MLTLRIYGTNLDVDGLLRTANLVAAAVFRKGQPEYPRSRPHGPVIKSSGVNISVSDATFQELDRQIADGEAFLARHAEALRIARGFPGVEKLTFDFGVEWRDTVTQTDSFPASLLAALGTLGIDLDVSHYPIAHAD